MASAEYLRYLNQGATRNLPLSPQLTSALGFLPELGVTAEVFSGGQPEKGSGGARVGSVRHDHGDAADVFFVKDGRRLDWANPEDRPLFEEIVRRGKASGLTGFGAGPGYMQAGSMHVGFGSPGVWGAGGKSATAPDWLVAAYGGAPAPSQAPDTSGDTTLVGGAANDTLATGDYMPPNNPGGLGGLGGFINSGAGGDLLQAIGASLMGSPSNAPLAGVGAAMTDARQLRMKQEALDQDRAEKQAQQQALELALRSQGFTAEQAAAYAVSPSAANVAVDGRNQQMKLGMAREAQARENSFLSGIAGAAGAEPYAPAAEVIPDVVVEPSPLVAPAAGAPAAPAMSKTAALNQSFKAADDVIASEGFKDASAPKPVNFATGNATVDQLMAKRAKLAALLVTAPSDDAFQRGKLALDQIDKQVEQYAPTGAMKEYTFAMRQRQDAGEPIVKFEAWDQSQRKASATTVNTGSDSGAFYKTADEGRAKSFLAASDAGVAAQRQMVQVDQLESLLGNVETGGLAQLKQVAGEYGIKTEGLDDIQAASALISQMVPSQRAPGSGTMSDADLALFKSSLPRILNQEGGNKVIIETMRGIANYDRQIGDIADQVLNREITPAEGRRMMATIENPLAKLKPKAGTKAPAATAAPAASGIKSKYGLE